LIGSSADLGTIDGDGVVKVAFRMTDKATEDQS